MAPLRILICGAGIAGNALAFWLIRLGHEVTVIERWPELRASGLQLDLRGHGIEVMKRMGLEKAFRAVAAPELGLQIVDSEAKCWAFFPANHSGSGRQSFTSEFEIMRKDLCQIMYDVAKEKASYLFGTSIESFEEQDEALEVRFTDGKTDRFDLVVGADGQWSRTRKLMLGPDVPNGHYPINECAAYFTVPRLVQKGEDYNATCYISTGGRFVMTRRNDPNYLQVYMMGKSVTERLKTVQRGDVEGEKQAFREVFQGAGWQVNDILNLLDKSDDFYCERQGVVRLEFWSQGRVVLLGDAAYCPTANAGMGTSSAMVGAYILAGEIGRHCGCSDTKHDDPKSSINTALKAYEHKFRPFMDKVQKGIGEPSIFDKIPWTTLTVTIVYWFLWLASTLRLDSLIMGPLRESKDGWDLPDYIELRTA